MTLQERLAPGKYRLTAGDYTQLAAIGAFGDASTELIAGEIIVMRPEWRPQMRVKDELSYRLRRALEDRGSELFVGTGGSVALGTNAMPRPDIVVTDDIAGEEAVPASSIALIVEVSASTIAFDLADKAAMYALAAIPEYWVADVNARVVHQMWQPRGDGYANRRDIAFGDPLRLATIADVTIAPTNF